MKPACATLEQIYGGSSRSTDRDENFPGGAATSSPPPGWQNDTLFTIGWSLAPADALKARVEYAGRTDSLEIRAIGISRPDLPDRPHPVGKVMVLRFRVPGTRACRRGSSSSTLRRRIRDLGRSLSQRDRRRGHSREAAGLGWLDASVRARIVALLVETLDQVSRQGRSSPVIFATSEMRCANRSVTLSGTSPRECSSIMSSGSMSGCFI